MPISDLFSMAQKGLEPYAQKLEKFVLDKEDQVRQLADQASRLKSQFDITRTNLSSRIQSNRELIEQPSPGLSGFENELTQTGLEYVKSPLRAAEYVLTPGKAKQEAAKGTLEKLGVAGDIAGIIPFAGIIKGGGLLAKTGGKVAIGTAKTIVPKYKSAIDALNDPAYIAKLKAAWVGVKPSSAQQAIKDGLTEEQYVKGQGTPLYHGTKSSISDISQSDVWQYGDPGALYGQGTYLTNSKSVAGGYAKTKGAGVEGKVLESFLKSDVKLLDLDKILTTQEYSIFSNVEKSIMDAYKLDGEVTNFSGMKGSEAYRALRETLAAAGIPKYEAGEWIDGLQQGFKEQGYHGFKHIGGIRGGEKSGVSIIFPNDKGVFPKELLQATSQLRTEYQAAQQALDQEQQ